ncbi:MAG: hypothetical protein IJ493_07805 [Clostridia bacterium]|nr:hypothetical protein [Clostridia bacterium]
MDFIYFEQPILLIIPAILLALQVLSRFLRAPMWLTAVSCLGHTAGIVILLLWGGTLEDVLVLVLLTATVGMLACPIPGKEDNP